MRGAGPLGEFEVVQVIERTKRGEDVSPADVVGLVKGFGAGTVSEAQMSAWMMAVCLRDLSDRAATALTTAMIESGASIDLSGFERTADKHSTGGVGDKTTLVAAPLAAAAGCTVVKMSGRGLGHTGGTIDKLEAIPGLRTALSAKELRHIASEVGLVIASQTADLAPADKALYALRHRTGTVDSISLIAASVMSKKIAAGAGAIVLDVKCGRGAFMRTRSDAERLADLMLRIGQAHGRKLAACITPMDQPLGCAVGHALEVREAVETLRNNGPDDLRELSVELATRMTFLSGAAPDLERAREAVSEALGTGAGHKKLLQMARAQGGDTRALEDPSRLPAAPVVEVLWAPAAGQVTRVDARRIGEAVAALGGARGEKEPDRAVGIVLRKKEGDPVEAGEPLAEIHARSAEDVAKARDQLGGAIRIGDGAHASAPGYSVRWLE